MSARFGEWTQRRERVLLVAGGPSFAAADPDRIVAARLAGVTILAVNEAAAFLPAADVAFTIDSGILRTRLPFYPGRLVAAVPDNYLEPGARKKGWREPPVRSALDRILLLRRVQAAELAADRGVIQHNGSSGGGALNLAYHMRPQRLALAGFDLDQLDQYWYGPGRRCARPWAEDLDWWARAAAQLQARRIQVVNGSPQSRIECWPRVTPAEAIAWLLG